MDFFEQKIMLLSSPQKVTHSRQPLVLPCMPRQAIPPLSSYSLSRRPHKQFSNVRAIHSTIKTALSPGHLHTQTQELSLSVT